MEKQKCNVAVIIEDGEPKLDTIAELIQGALNPLAHVKVRGTSKLTIADVLGADVYIFGVADASSPHWAELKRLFLGINLAGRAAGFFMLKKSAADALKTAFEPTELRFVSDFVADGKHDPAAWAKAELAY